MHYEVIVRGKAGTWAAIVPTKAQAEAMKEDGLEVVELHNSMPAFVQENGFERVWIFFEDIYKAPSRWWRK